MGLFDKIKNAVNSLKDQYVENQKNEMYNQFIGFKREDFENRSFDVHKNIEKYNSLLTPEQEYNFSHYSNYVKYAFVNNFIKSVPEFDNIGGALTFCIDNILENGFNIHQNKLLYFMLNVPKAVNYEIVELVKNLIDSKDLNPYEKLLYEPSLYTEEVFNIIFKIKALTYALNEKLQSRADKLITPQDFMDENGQLITADEMREVLKEITVDES